MARSFLKLYTLDLGFEANHLLTLRTQLVESKYPKPEQRQIFYDALLDAPARPARRHAGGHGLDAAARRFRLVPLRDRRPAREHRAHTAAGLGRRCRPRLF